MEGKKARSANRASKVKTENQSSEFQRSHYLLEKNNGVKYMLLIQSVMSKDVGVFMYVQRNECKDGQ